MTCNKKVSPNYDYRCILELNHPGKHKYVINGKEVTIHGCCPDGQVVRYEAKN